MSKSLVTNLVALVLTVIGFLKPFDSNLILMIGLFSLSGGITNWLAIHMLFEKIPFIYGSGIIPINFKFFKIAIKNLIINEFFSDKNIQKFTSKIGNETILSISSNINYNSIFEELTDSIEKSQLGGMLAMVGGRKALEPLRKPIIKRLESLIKKIIEKNKTTSLDSKLVSDVKLNIEKLIDDRLNELSPQDIKIIIRDVIDKHLGWLVIWGGIFGGIIGGISYYVSSIILWIIFFWKYILKTYIKIKYGE